MTEEIETKEISENYLTDSPEIGVNFIEGKRPSFANLERHKRFVSFLFSITGSRYYQENQGEKTSPLESSLSKDDLTP